jgi:hypothetical protein
MLDPETVCPVPCLTAVQVPHEVDHGEMLSASAGAAARSMIAERTAARIVPG